MSGRNLFEADPMLAIGRPDGGHHRIRVALRAGKRHGLSPRREGQADDDGDERSEKDEG